VYAEWFSSFMTRIIGQKREIFLTLHSVYSTMRNKNPKNFHFDRRLIHSAYLEKTPRFFNTFSFWLKNTFVQRYNFRGPIKQPMKHVTLQRLIGKNTIIFAPKNLKNGPVPYLGLDLNIHVIKSQIHLVRQSL
jgi:hypothetical protein